MLCFAFLFFSCASETPCFHVTKSAVKRSNRESVFFSVESNMPERVA